MLEVPIVIKGAVGILCFWHGCSYLLLFFSVRLRSRRETRAGAPHNIGCAHNFEIVW